MEIVSARLEEFRATVLSWLASPQFYFQLAAIAAAIGGAFAISALLRHRVSAFHDVPGRGPWFALRRLLYRSRDLLFPLSAMLLLDIASDVSVGAVEQAWLVRIAQSLAVVYLLYTLITRFIGDPLITNLMKWVGIPLATLHVFGWLDDTIRYLDSLAITVGSVQFSVYTIGRTIFFGIILFWLGRISNTTGKRMIRGHPRLDVGAKEVAAKLFETTLVVLVALLFLNVMGISLTALAVFGGAFGIGLGLGLQRIAANFISGIIILLDRSITLDDYIELEDGRSGRLRELNMRSATLETFDGKDIVVPNETFVSTAFTNWTHHHKKQRYEIRFQVAYDTDVPGMIEIVREVVASHPQVLSGETVPLEERPDAEIDGFGDSGIEILVEFWMEGIDDGPNRVGAELRLMIWTALKQHGVVIPFPQREIKILGGVEGGADRAP